MSPRYQDQYQVNFIFGPMIGLAFIVGALWLLVLLRGPEGALGPLWLPPIVILAAVLLALNYRTMKLQLWDDGIVVGFGIINRRIRWGDVSSYTLVPGPEPRRGDLGYHINRVEGVWRASYIAPIPERVLFRLNSGIIREVFVSVSRSAEFLSLLEHRMGVPGEE